MRARGFSLIELVTVIIIVGALAVLVIPRLNPQGFGAFSFREEALSAARYAQKTAMASSCAVQLDVDAGADTVSLDYRSGGDDRACGGGAFDDPVANPSDGSPFVVGAPGGVDVTSGGTVAYDGFGRADSGLAIGVEPGPDLALEAETGYAHEQ